MDSRIRSQVRLVEDELEAQVLAIWETGSRAYNFSHSESDYDISVLYRQKDTAYILEDSYQQGFASEQLDISLDEDVEIEGWDVKRFRDLLFGYDPMVYEALNSPTSYFVPEEVERIAKHAVDNINPINLFLGYQSAAKSMLKQRESDAKEVPKKYLFHVVRNVLIARYIEQTHQYPPLDWQEFLSTASSNIFIEISRERAEELLAAKQSPEDASELIIPPERGALEEFFAYELSYEDHIPDSEIDKNLVTQEFRQLLEREVTRV